MKRTSGTQTKSVALVAPPRPKSSQVLAMNAARQEAAAARRATDVIARLHHLPDAALCDLARAVWVEVREREKTAARETMANETNETNEEI